MNIRLKETKDNAYDIVLVVEDAIVINDIEAVYKDGVIELRLPKNIEFLNQIDIINFEKAILQDIEGQIAFQAPLYEKTRKKFHTFNEIDEYVEKVIFDIKHHKY